MSGHPSPLKSADAAASVHRVLPTPTRSVTSSNIPSPRLRNSRFLPPFVANSKLSCMMRVVVRCHRSTSTGCASDVFEAASIKVLEEGQVAIAIYQHVLATIVVDVAPHGAHGHALTGPVEVGEPRQCGDIDKDRKSTR